MRSTVAALWRWLLLISVSALLQTAISVKHHDFKTCEQSGFCKRNRAFANRVKAAPASWLSPYEIDQQSLAVNEGSIQATILKKLDDDNLNPVQFPLVIDFLNTGSVRIRIDELRRREKQVQFAEESQARKERYHEAADWVISGGLEAGHIRILSKSPLETRVGYDVGKEAIIRHKPFKIDFIQDGEIHVSLNSFGLLNLEHWRSKNEASHGDQTRADNQTDGDYEDTWWAETFGGNTDSKPRGPESIALDIAFPGYSTVYGIPEHAGPLALKDTLGGPGNYDQPYRLYNADVFEYIMDSPMTLYGSIPFMQAHKKSSTVGVFWLNSAETWVDIDRSPTQVDTSGAAGQSPEPLTVTHWFSESGILDLFIFLGGNPRDILSSYAQLTGTTQLPQQFAISYHQCRWNYVSQDDVKDVDRRFDRQNIPYDVIWLDIEYTDDRKYFTWDKNTFETPQDMLNQLEENKRKLVAIIDPHIKNTDNYAIVDELKKNDLAVHDKQNKIYEGWCWPGSSHWVDCFNPAAINWWRSLFQYDKFKGSMSNVFIWNDMNEPSVFNGPETTMPKDNLHYGNWEHRDVHNLNGLTFHNATYEALLMRDAARQVRPFVLTRAFFAGSQRLGAMWTGDNLADWNHLRASIPMILAQNIAGFGFAGADVGGFFGNPDKELLSRWYQAGSFYPFFRAHAHIDTRRREPYLLGYPYTDIVTNALRLRYSLLPVWYNAFHSAATLGEPIIKPQFYVHPADEAGYLLDDQFYVGNSGLLVKPVLDQGAESVEIYIADPEIYYKYQDFEIIEGAGKRHRVAAPLDTIPLLMQGGHIFFRKDRPRRSSGLMQYDPYTMIVVLGQFGIASGELYVDDGETLDYQKGAYIHKEFRYDGQKLSTSDIVREPAVSASLSHRILNTKITEIVIVGAPMAWSRLTTVACTKSDGSRQSIDIKWNQNEEGKANWAVVQLANISVNDNWAIDF